MEDIIKTLLLAYLFCSLVMTISYFDESMLYRLLQNKLFFRIIIITYVLVAIWILIDFGISPSVASFMSLAVTVLGLILSLTLDSQQQTINKQQENFNNQQDKLNNIQSQQLEKKVRTLEFYTKSKEYMAEAIALNHEKHMQSTILLTLLSILWKLRGEYTEIKSEIRFLENLTKNELNSKSFLYNINYENRNGIFYIQNSNTTLEQYIINDFLNNMTNLNLSIKQTEGYKKTKFEYEPAYEKLINKINNIIEHPNATTSQ